MTIPLILLAIFAVIAGWAGIPESFPVIGPIVNNNLFPPFRWLDHLQADGRAL